MIILDERAFADFLSHRRNDLRRIVRQSPNRLELQEMESEAWVAAQVLSDRRNRALDFRDAVDQDALLGRLYARFVKWPGVLVRYAMRLDHGPSDDEDHHPTLASLLRAPHDTDPQIRLILREERLAFLGGVRNVLYFIIASLWEIAIKRGLGRDDFHADPGVLRRGLLESGYEELPITGDHAAAVGVLPALHKDPFDRMLVGQAAVEGMTLVTADAQVAKYPGSIRRV